MGLREQGAAVARQAQERDDPELGVTVWPDPHSWRDPCPGVPTLNTLNQAPQELASASPDVTCELYLRRLSETRKKEVNPSQTFSVLLQPGNRGTQSA